jgi:hypothetical protein
MMSDRKDRPAYVRFVRRAIEDRSVKSVGGRWPKKDVDYALVTPPYSKDVFEAVAAEWLEQMGAEVRNGRLPEEWLEPLPAAVRQVAARAGNAALMASRSWAGA